MGVSTNSQRNMSKYNWDSLDVSVHFKYIKAYDVKLNNFDQV